jgi:hypothetical protein
MAYPIRSRPLPPLEASASNPQDNPSLPPVVIPLRDSVMNVDRFVIWCIAGTVGQVIEQ